jgi:hypothetical protein
MKLKNLKQLNPESPFRPYRIRPFLSEQLDLFELVKLSQQIADFNAYIAKALIRNNDSCKIKK